MIARAPGKVVISGAYAVLAGAPAIVVAVDRYASADAGRPATFVTPEVAAALGARPAPWFDAGPLRAGDRKLGLGSSAAILVASLAALAVADGRASDDRALAEGVFPVALDAHARAQGGGSGIDVAASCFGGTRVARRTASGLVTTPAELPASLVLEVWAATEPASTPALLAAVRALAARDPERERALIEAQAAAAAAAADALTGGDADAFVRALRLQGECLDRLGQAAGVPIVTDAVRALGTHAASEGGAVLPAGAGGGDVAIYAGPRGPSSALRAAASAAGHEPLALRLGARGVHLAPAG